MDPLFTAVASCGHSIDDATRVHVPCGWSGCPNCRRKHGCEPGRELTDRVLVGRA